MTEDADAPAVAAAPADLSPAVAPTPVPAPAQSDASANKWAERGAIVVASGDPGPLNGRGVVLAERRAPAPKRDSKGEKLDANEPDQGDFLPGVTYGAADALVRYDERAVGADGVEVLTVGDGLSQVGFAGLSSKQGDVCVGPASPIYAAVNVAYQRGAREIEIVGMTEAEKAQLIPWFDALDSYPELHGVTINF